jgi:AcrR family transcriptional regulator
VPRTLLWSFGPIGPTDRFNQLAAAVSPHPRFARLPAERRHAVLQAAAQEFAAHGYEGASLNRILEGAGVSKGSFYYYFDDKADLFAAVVDEATEILLPPEPLDLAALTGESFWPRLEQLFFETAERALAAPWLATAGRLFYHPPAAELEPVVRVRLERARGYLAALVERGRELGAVRDDVPVSLLVAQVTAAAEAGDRWMVESWEGLRPEELEAAGRGIFAALRRLAAPDPRTRGETR